MKISPTAIRQKAFETAFRGFEKNQVTDFLHEISAVMQQINQENLELRSKLQLVEGEAKRLKDVEDSLFRTLKTAEDTGAAIITEATEAADLIIAEANEIAESTTSRAFQYADQLKKQAEEHARIITSAAEAKAKDTVNEIRESLQGLMKSYDILLEKREALINSLKRTSQDTLNQIELSEAHFARIDSTAYQKSLEELSRTGQYTVTNITVLDSKGEQEIPHTEDEPDSQFEEDMTDSRPDEETFESIQALQQELGDLGKIPEEEEIVNQPPTTSEASVGPVVNRQDEHLEDLPRVPSQSNPSYQNNPAAEYSKKPSGSFFDQFD